MLQLRPASQPSKDRALFCFLPQLVLLPEPVLKENRARGGLVADKVDLAPLPA